MRPFNALSAFALMLAACSVPTAPASLPTYTPLATFAPLPTYTPPATNTLLPPPSRTPVYTPVHPSASPTTPVIMCTPPACKTAEAYYCPGTCPGGCGTQCATTTPPVVPAGSGEVQIMVYFVDSTRLAAGAPPFEMAVTRSVIADRPLPELVLNEYFRGPTAYERARGLQAVTSGFIGLASLEIHGGIARVYLDGPCASMGATYTVAQPIIKNLLQFAAIRYVKIYGPDRVTEQPEGAVHSIPLCLEP